MAQRARMALIVLAALAALIYMTSGPRTPEGSGQGPRRWTQEEFYTAFLTAYTQVRTAGIPWQIAYAVSASETGYGNGAVFQNTNNLFSILCSPSWKGKCYRGRPNSLTANPLGDSHRVYASYKESIDDWIRLMQTPHYQGFYRAAVAGMAGESFAELQRAGYAGTNQNYANLLRSTYSGVA